MEHWFGSENYFSDSEKYVYGGRLCLADEREREVFLHMKVKTKSIKLNFIMNVVLTMSSFIFPLVTFPYVSRVLLPEGTGKVSFAISVITYFTMFAQLGIPTYGIRACAQVRDDKECGNTRKNVLYIMPEI